MVKLALCLRAQLDRVSQLEPIDDLTNPYYYSFTLVCSSCRETHKGDIQFNRFEKTDLSGSRGDANLVWKCGNCKRESSVVIEGSPKKYEASDPPQRGEIIRIECRGCEATHFQSTGEWQCKGSESNTIFSSVDLSDGEWYDYDEKTKQDVSITEIEWELRRV